MKSLKNKKSFRLKGRRRNARYNDWRKTVKELSNNPDRSYKLFDDSTGKYVVVSDYRPLFRNYLLTDDVKKASSYRMIVFSLFLKDFGHAGKFRPVRAI